MSSRHQQPTPAGWIAVGHSCVCGLSHMDFPPIPTTFWPRWQSTFSWSGARTQGGWQSVARTSSLPYRSASSLRAYRRIPSSGDWRSEADWKSAIQQVGNLRYDRSAEFVMGRAPRSALRSAENSCADGLNQGRSPRRTSKRKSTVLRCRLTLTVIRHSSRATVMTHPRLRL